MTPRNVFADTDRRGRRCHGAPMTTRLIRTTASLLVSGAALVGTGLAVNAAHATSPQASRCLAGTAVRSVNVVSISALSEVTNAQNAIASSACAQPQLMAGANICVPTQAVSNPLPRQICVLPNPWVPA
jgi:hypothetical protein